MKIKGEGVYKIPLEHKKNILDSYVWLSNKIQSDSEKNKLNIYNKKTIQGRLHYSKDLKTYNYIKNNYMNPKYVSDCPAGKLFGIIDAKGDVYACEILENDKIGSLRDADMNFKKVWDSDNNIRLRRFIKKTKCNCTYECALTYNFMSNFKYQPSFIKSILDF